MWRPAYKTFARNGAVGSPLDLLVQYRRPLIVSGFVLGGLYVANLEPAPVTGRYRLMIVPRWFERAIGETGYRQTMAQYGRYLLPDGHPDVVRVKRIMRDIIKVTSNDHLAPPEEWQIHVIGGRNFPPNAFVLPGGKVFVFQSILPIAESDDGLATVLSHETAHQVCRHTAENMSKAPLYMLAATVLYAVTGSAGINDLILSMLLRFPASRTMETEADHVGIMIMARACYNPSAAVGLWQRMMELEKQTGSPPELLSTHPASAHRIHDIEALLPEANKLRAESCTGVSWFY